MNMLYLAAAYRGVSALMEYSNFRPTKPVKRRSSLSYPTEVTEIDEPRSGGLRQQPDESDALDTSGKYYIRRQSFRYVVYMVRKYIRLLIPILFATFGIKYVVPFLSDGPIYLIMLRKTFLIPCENAWYLNFLFIQNWLYWSPTYSKDTCYPFITDGMVSADSYT